MNISKVTKARRKAGIATRDRYGNSHFSELAKKMHEKRKKWEEVLKAIIIKDLDNPVTLQSVREKLEQIDEEYA